MLLVSGTTKSMAKAIAMGLNVGFLLTPNNGNSIGHIVNAAVPWAIDNGAFSGFNAERFTRLADRARGKPRLLWVVSPDVVGDCRKTMGQFAEWKEKLAGLPLAFVGQDGQEDYELPWDDFVCFFVGGSTEWKLSEAAADLMGEAKRRGKWVHMGRVNSCKRLTLAYDAGCDSVDGSSMSRFGDKYIWMLARFVKNLQEQGVLHFPIPERVSGAE